MNTHTHHMARALFALLPLALAAVLAAPFAWADDTAGSPALSLQNSHAPAPQAETAADIKPGVYTITTGLRTDGALDVSGGSSANGARVQVWSSNGTAAQRWRIESAGGGYYRIINVGSGKALDVAYASSKSGTKVWQYASNGTAAQKWRFVAVKGGYKITSALSDDLALDVSGGSRRDGAGVQVYAANGTSAQVWTLTAAKRTVADGLYTLTCVASGKALDVSGGSIADGGNVQQWTANGTMAQSWKLTYDSRTGYYTVLSAGSGKALDVSGASSRDGANVWQYAANGTKAQQWAIAKNADGTLTFTSAASGKALDVSGASKRDGANVQQWTSNGTDAQKWRASAVSTLIPEGTYFVQSRLGANNVLDLRNASYAEGANIQVHAKNSSDAQRYYFRNAGNGYYTIQSAVTGQYVGASATSAGTNVVQQGARTLWKPELTEEGIVFTVKGSTAVLKAQGAASNANVALGNPGTDASVKWVLRSTSLSQAKVNSIKAFTADSLAVRNDLGSQQRKDTLSITLDQIVKWNWEGNPYNKKRLDAEKDLRAYMDPANGSRYQFADLRVLSSTTAEQIDAFIASTELGRRGMLAGTGAYFIEAAKTYGLNQDYLVAHAILESAWGTSNYAMGTKRGDKTYYNFYGIGAYDDSPDNAIDTAGQYGWSSPKAAIMGAAQWIARNYVYSSTYPQYTLYAMKWDYLRSDSTKAYGWHQYAMSAHWAQSIGNIMDNIYKTTGTGDSVSYVVPLYRKS